MNTEFFIARRIFSGATDKKRVSRPIIIITVMAITISIIFMILSMAVVTGFQNEIRNKVVGFGSHIVINSYASNNSLESTPIPIEQDFYPALQDSDGVRHIQIYATKPGIIQTNDEIQGVIAKGMGTDFDWSFFQRNLKEGDLLNLNSEEPENKILISSIIASRLKISLGDTMTTFFIKKSSGKALAFEVAGIYDTGLAEFDEEIIMLDIRHIQRLNNWGSKAFLTASSNCDDGTLEVTATGYGFYNNLDFQWSHPGWTGKGPHKLCVTRDTSISVIVSDFPSDDYTMERIYPDTAFLDIKIINQQEGDACICSENALEINSTNTGGSGKYYTGGFEVLLDDYEQLQEMDEIIYYITPNGKTTQTITEQFPEIFRWLSMIDVNVWIIVILMIVVAVINMSSALLILILEKTNMIGMLKAMGMNNWNIRKVFLYNAMWLAVIGMFWGNVIGIILAVIQKYTGFLTLPQENYYLSEVPINLQWDHILLINLGTLVICVLMMIIPSYLITRISPIKAIRFE